MGNTVCGKYLHFLEDKIIFLRACQKVLVTLKNETQQILQASIFFWYVHICHQVAKEASIHTQLKV